MLIRELVGLLSAPLVTPPRQQIPLKNHALAAICVGGQDSVLIHMEMLVAPWSVGPSFDRHAHDCRGRGQPDHGDVAIALAAGAAYAHLWGQYRS